MPIKTMTRRELRARASEIVGGMGVYFLWSELGQLLYVGMSTKIFVRIGEHARAGRIPFAHVTCIDCHDSSHRADLETAYIRAFQPPFNGYK